MKGLTVKRNFVGGRPDLDWKEEEGINEGKGEIIAPPPPRLFSGTEAQSLRFFGGTGNKKSVLITPIRLMKIRPHHKTGNSWIIRQDMSMDSLRLAKKGLIYLTFFSLHKRQIY